LNQLLKRSLELQEHARRLEKEAVALWADAAQVAHASGVDHPVAVYEVDGEDIVVTKADMATVRARLLKIHSEEAIRELALVDKMTERHQNLPRAKQERRFWENVEAIRAEAIAKGVAIDDPAEAAVGD